MARESQVPQVVIGAEEEIHAYTVAPDGVTLAVGRGNTVDAEFVFDEDQDYETISLTGPEFTALMSADGGEENLLPGKPAGTFRKDDLWVFVDKERSKPA